MFYRKRTMTVMLILVFMVLASSIPMVTAISRSGTALLLDSVLNIEKRHVVFEVSVNDQVYLADALETRDSRRAMDLLQGEVNRMVGLVDKAISTTSEKGLEVYAEHYMVAVGYIAMIGAVEDAMPAFPLPYPAITLNSTEPGVRAIFLPVYMLVVNSAESLESLGFTIEEGSPPSAWNGGGVIEVAVASWPGSLTEGLGGDVRMIKLGELELVVTSRFTADNPVRGFYNAPVPSPVSYPGLVSFIAISEDPRELALHVVESITSSESDGNGGVVTFSELRDFLRGKSEALGLPLVEYSMPYSLVEGEDVIAYGLSGLPEPSLLSASIAFSYRPDYVLDIVIGGETLEYQGRLASSLTEILEQAGYCYSRVIVGLDTQESRDRLGECPGRGFIKIFGLPDGERFVLTNINTFMALSSIILLIAMLSIVSSGELLSIMMGDFRPWLAMVIARGAPTSKIRIALVSLAAASGLLAVLGGVLASSLILPLATRALTGMPLVVTFDAIALHGDTWVFAAIIVAAGSLISLYPRLKEASNIKAVEAVRRVESIRRAHVGRVWKASLVFLLIALVSTFAGLHGDLEGLIEGVTKRFGTLTAIPLIILLILSVFLSPLAPSVITYYLSALASQSLKLYTASSKAVTAILPRNLSGLVSTSSYNLRERMRSSAKVLTLAYSALVALALAPGLLRQVLERLGELSESIGFSITLTVSARALEIGSILGVGLAAVTFLVMAFATVNTALQLLEREMVILRVRGGSMRDTLIFTYGSLAPLILYSLASGLAIGVFTAYSIMAVNNLFLAMSSPAVAGKLGIPYPQPSLVEALMVAGPAFFVVVIPGALSLRSFTRPDLGSLLRRG